MWTPRTVASGCGCARRALSAARCRATTPSSQSRETRVQTAVGTLVALPVATPVPDLLEMPGRNVRHRHQHDAPIRARRQHRSECVKCLITDQRRLVLNDHRRRRITAHRPPGCRQAMSQPASRSTAEAIISSLLRSPRPAPTAQENS